MGQKQQCGHNLQTIQNYNPKNWEPEIFKFFQHKVERTQHFTQVTESIRIRIIKVTVFQAMGSRTVVRHERQEVSSTDSPGVDGSNPVRGSFFAEFICSNIILAAMSEWSTLVCRLVHLSNHWTEWSTLGKTRSALTAISPKRLMLRFTGLMFVPYWYMLITWRLMPELRWLSFVNHVGIWSHFSDSMLWGHSEEECSALWIGIHAVSDLLIYKGRM